jgi:hypothetical protein
VDRRESLHRAAVPIDPETVPSLCTRVDPEGKLVVVRRRRANLELLDPETAKPR